MLVVKQLGEIQLQITNRLHVAICSSVMQLYDVIVEAMDGNADESYPSATLRKESGTNKTASGTNKTASGTNKTASGTNKTASGTNKTASGTNKTASGTKSKNGMKKGIELQDQILQFIESHSEATIQEVSDHIQASRRTVLRYIQLLKQKNRIKQIGSKRKPKWEIIKE